MSWHDCVYEPSDDTFLLAELAADLVRRLAKRGSLDIAEIGSGSGFVTRFLLESFPTIRIVALDISPYALKASRESLLRAPGGDARGLVVMCDAGSCISNVDVVVFNPPYLPPSEDDRLLESLCEGWYLRAVSDPDAMKRMCVEATRAARLAIVAVYSSLSPVDLAACMEFRGFRVARRVIKPFFFEKLYGIVATKGWSIEC